MRLFAFSVLVAVLAASVLSSPARAAVRVVLTPPVSAPVIDPFRLPFGPYGPGNRGLEYATRPGQPAAACH